AHLAAALRPCDLSRVHRSRDGALAVDPPHLSCRGERHSGALQRDVRALVLDRMSAEVASRRAGLVVFGLALFAAAGILASRPLGYDVAAYWSAARHLLEGAPLYP